MNAKKNTGLPCLHDLVAETPGVQLATKDGVGGVQLANGSFVPWDDLGYNAEIGFYRRSEHPDVETQARHCTWSIHPVQFEDGWQAFALLDRNGHGFLLGERWEVAELLPVLRSFLFDGLMGEPISEHDEALGVRWLTISEACEMAHEYDPERYPYETQQERVNLATRIRTAAQRGSLHGWKKDASGRYKFRATAFRHWLQRNSKRRRR